MSGSYVYKTQEDKYKYIKDVFNALILRDIKQKYNIRNVDILNNLSDFLIDNISNLTSSNNITKYLNSNKIEITDKTIKNYIDYLCNSFAFYKVKRYDIKGKKYLARWFVYNSRTERLWKRRYIRLTYLIPELLEEVDNKRIAFRPAVELSYLEEDYQYVVLNKLQYDEVLPSLSQAITLLGTIYFFAFLWYNEKIKEYIYVRKYRSFIP